MSFRIDRAGDEYQLILRVHGRLLGREAEQILREQIVRAVSEKGHVVLDVAGVTVIDSGCLAIIESGLGDWLSVEGGGAYLNMLLGR
jgi:anti-anti-sigma regulatory factor